MQTLNPSSETAAERFQHLQGKLRDYWQAIEESNTSEYTMLVLPSLSLDQREMQKIPGVHHYEERLLFSLIRLQNPRARVIYITSQPLSPIVVDYYLHLLSGIPFSHARDRLLLLSTYDGSQKPLSQKLLERPRLMERIRRALHVTSSTYAICYNSTPWERELSLQLEVPLFALNPDLLYWGTKSGSRQIFAECGIPHPDGSDLVQSVEDLAVAAADLWERQPHLKRMVIKLNQGFSGEGNALLDLQPFEIAAPGAASHCERVAVLQGGFALASFQAQGETWENFSSRIPELGAIVEAFVEGKHKRSPSVQMVILPSGEVEVLSTHDQILGGPDGQIYLGCQFPADADYRLRLQELGQAIGRNLSQKGALERFGVDFIAVRDPAKTGVEAWDLQAIEINLRKGGTTHPQMTLKLLTDGHYDLENGLFYSPHGQAKYYTATDNLKKEQYRGLLPTDLMDIIALHRLHFDSSTETGTLFHLMGTLSEFGKVGLTSIGNSPEQAETIYRQVVKVLDAETQLEA
nr:peptide ligase PGM1-related protein [Synechococcus sp. PCC 7336]